MVATPTKKDVSLSMVALVTFILALLLFAAAGGFVGYRIGRSGFTPPEPDTVRIVTIDTFWVTTPPDTVTVTMVKYVRVPFYVTTTDTIVDSILVPLTYEQHFARLDDVADVWYSGVDATIDSARTYHRTETVTITNTVVERKAPRLTADLGAGALWHNGAVNPYGLAVVRLHRLHTTFGAFGGIDPTGQWAAGLNVTYRIDLIK